MTDPTPRTRRRLWPLLAAIIAILIVVGVGAFALVSDRTGSVTVAVVNNDAGVTDAAGTTVNAGDDLVSQLTASDAFDWATDTEGDPVATVTIPDGFSAALGSVDTPAPEQAQVSVEFTGADADAQRTLTALVDAASIRTGAAGIQGLITRTARAKAQLQQAVLPAQLLSAATKGASAQGEQLLGSVDQFLPFLQTASDGADQLVAASNSVGRLVDGARRPTADLSARLNQAGLTIADVTRGAGQLRDLLGTVQNTLSANGIDAAPVEQTRSDIALATDQLSSFSTLLGSGPDTLLGTAVQNGYDQIAEISAQLSSAGAQLQAAIGPIASGAPDLLGGAKDQILGAITQLSTLSDTIVKQVNTGVTALPTSSAAASSVLADPVNVNYSSTARSTTFSAENTAILFGIVIVLLAAALVWTNRRRG